MFFFKYLTGYQIFYGATYWYLQAVETITSRTSAASAADYQFIPCLVACTCACTCTRLNSLCY